MKSLNHILFAALNLVIAVLVIYFMKPDNPFLVVFLLLIVGFFIFNLTIRKSLSYKNYFTSKYNLFTTKIKYQKVYDIPKDLMFEKLIEVINDSNFKLVEIDKEKSEILAITTITFKSWGENLYIERRRNDDDFLFNYVFSDLLLG